MAAVPIVEDFSLRVTGSGYQVQIRLPWYRSLPLSCIEKVQLKLDGKAVEPAQMRWGVNEHQYGLDELGELVEEFWFVQDSAYLSVMQPDKISPGETHTIECELTLRFPYIPIGPGKFLVNSNQYTTTQVAS